MLRITLWLLVGVLVWGFASCSITCPDGNVCSEFATCCKTKHGYSCCPYPKAVCCSDLAHCCPAGFRCDQVTQMCENENQPWMNIPMVKKEAAENPSTPVLPVYPLQELENNHVPDQKKSSVVHCDNYYTCPSGTTCCRHPTGVWFCCPYFPGRCCLDGYHCCPYGYDCDLTYTHCLRQGLRYPFTPKEALSSVPASLISISEDKSSLQETPMTALTEASGGIREAGVIRCDPKFYCSQGTTCCKGPTGHWSCCPYPLGKCCADGQHCCEYGYTCDPTSLSCRRWYSQIPSGTQERAKTD
ncbi:progranulin-like isoform X3 [Siniperca chuatsi]|uniref:progranulin-like isoform X3 n=1 Tax=Siniperca chuatsi TaxID=119488 RepID=UPI001CE072EB|nr:progranulin-like isoform X3 [Siniperca chuatsi]XP_044026944.1 progranulin-like isoform X3 [Siniperca chuatsi]XP_044026945.1 progranulin-like isoform X3 [Siniperca chuatsi]